MANSYPQYFNLSDENEETLKGVTVVAYDLNSGAILERTTTDQAGRAAFNTVPGETVGYRPEITRRSGKLGDKPLGGFVRLTPEKRKIQENITPEEFSTEPTTEEPPKPPSDEQKPFTIKWLKSAPTPCNSRRIIVDSNMYKQALRIMNDDEVDRSVGWVMVGRISAEYEWRFPPGGYFPATKQLPTLVAVQDCTIEQIDRLDYISRPAVTFGNITNQWNVWILWKLKFTGPKPRVNAVGTTEYRGLFVPCPDTEGDWTDVMDADYNVTVAADRLLSITMNQDESKSPSGGFDSFMEPNPLDFGDHGTWHFNGVDHTELIETPANGGHLDHELGVAGAHNGKSSVDWDKAQSLAGVSLRFTSCKPTDPTQHIEVDAADLPDTETRLMLVFITSDPTPPTFTGWDLLRTQAYAPGDTTYYVHHLTTSYDGTGGIDVDTGIDPCQDIAWSLYNLNPFNGMEYLKEDRNDSVDSIVIDINVEFGLVTIVSLVSHPSAPIIQPSHVNPINKWVVSGGTRLPGLDFKIYTYVGRDANNFKADNVLGVITAFKLTH